MLFTFMDLEPRRKAESSLRQSEERFQKAFRMLPVPGAVLRAADLVLLDMNQAFVQATGYSSEEVVGRHGETVGLWHEEFLAAIGELLTPNGVLRNRDLKIVRKDGDIISCQVSAEKVSINGLDCILLAWLDITDRKRSELELVDAIEKVMQDTSWFSKSLVEKLANVKREGALPDKGEFADLTRREREVFEALCTGQSDKEIAKKLAVALSTVRNHVAKIYMKLNVHNRNAALLWARNHGYFRSGNQRNE